MKQKRPASSLRLILTMGITGFLSGMALVGIYLLTLPRIQRNQAEALNRAIFKVIPNVHHFETLVLVEGSLKPYQGTEGQAPRGEAVYLGLAQNGEPLSFAIPAEGPGFQDNIRLLYGFNLREKRIVGMQVLESRETPGLGDKIIFDEAFLRNFSALEIDPEIVPVKKGEKIRPNEVDCISGATISSKAIVRIMNQSTRRWLPHLTALPKMPTPGGETPNPEESERR